MAIAVSFRDIWSDGRRIHAIGSVVFSGNYAAGGEVVDVKAAAANAQGQRWMANSQPDIMMLQGKAGYHYEYDRANRKIIIRQSAGAGAVEAELAAAAYPAGVTGDTIDFYCIGKKFV